MTTEPLFRVEKGTVGPAELAALTAVLLQRVAHHQVCAEEPCAQSPRWSRSGTRHTADAPLSWRSAHLRNTARRPWLG
ncbi:acyl-CoA carboxylase subunit epsilon [Streptomyces sp. NPDC048282]|uniref:acyl-CoA carboxylase subunit epsilon n=1 Tax=Streptomyces sp. NPDC048282 TaxID=3365528 RepID=UPI0037130DF3